MNATDTQHSPARVIRKYLLDVLEGVRVEGTEDWPIFVSSLDDTEETPDQAICVYDTAGILDGKSMKSGETYTHYGISIRVRSIDFDLGWKKTKQLFEVLSEAQGELVVLDAAAYRIRAVSLTSGIITLGESETRGRRNWTLNAITSIINQLEET